LIANEIMRIILLIFVSDMRVSSVMRTEQTL